MDADVHDPEWMHLAVGWIAFDLEHEVLSNEVALETATQVIRGHIVGLSSDVCELAWNQYLEWRKVNDKQGD